MSDTSPSASERRLIRLHGVETERDGVTLRIAIPDYNPEDPTREISAGWFQGTPRGILLRGKLEDLRAIALIVLDATETR